VHGLKEKLPQMVNISGANDLRKLITFFGTLLPNTAQIPFFRGANNRSSQDFGCHSLLPVLKPQ
jgi:hypothetical protein